MTRWLTPAVLLLLLLLPAVVAANGEAVVAGELIVRWRDLSGQDLTLSLRSRNAGTLASITVARRLDKRTQVLKVAPAATARTLAELRARQDVEYAEPNYIRRALGVTPNDPRYPEQWHLPRVQIDKAWEITTGSAETVVAVIDTGIRDDHPDLRERLLPGYDFISSPDKAGDGDGRDSNPRDEGSTGFHGTHVAGIIAATTNNETGVAGINWHCRLLPIRALSYDSKDGTVGGSDSDIVAAIRWAAGLEVDGVPKNEHPADVINLSLGSPGYGETLGNAINDALVAGVVVVAAAGNDSINARGVYPAAYSGVITVGATDYENNVAWYSNYGSVVDLLAPGGDGDRDPSSNSDNEIERDILSTVNPNGSGYSSAFGTSQAAPVVSGVVSLMVALDPKLRQFTAADALLATSNKSVKCPDACLGGLINAEAALLYTIERLESNDPKDHLMQGGCSTHSSDFHSSDLLIVIVIGALVVLSVTRCRRRAPGRAPSRA